MVPKLHAKGRSFRGAAAYLLHDKGRAKTSHRVAWTETRNLACGEDPHHAWKIMAATAMSQSRLKEQAGVKATGRKSVDSVLHMTLSWHADEKPGLTREEMMRAALGAVRALKAGDRQVLFVAHIDEPQPHVHCLINRISPTDGRMLSSSKEKLALSRWAEAYEKERGKILCEERVLNNAARDRGEYVRGEPDKPRHIFELEAANQNRPDADQIKEEQQRRDAAVAKRNREVLRAQAEAWKTILDRHKAAKVQLQADLQRSIAEAKQSVHVDHREHWRDLHRDGETRMQTFEQNERHMLGRFKNAMKAIDFRALMRSDDRRRVLGEAFDLLASQGARLDAVRKEQLKHQRELEARQRQAEQARIAQIRADVERRRRAETERFNRERMDRMLADRMNSAAQRSVWRGRSQDRQAAWEEPIHTTERTAIEPARHEPASSAHPPHSHPTSPPAGPTNDHNAEQQRAYQGFMERMRQRDEERSRGRDHDRDR